MEASSGQRQGQLEFALASVSELSSSTCASASSAPSSWPSVVARFSADSGVPELRLYRSNGAAGVISVDLATAQVAVSFGFHCHSCVTFIPSLFFRRDFIELEIECGYVSEKVKEDRIVIIVYAPMNGLFEKVSMKYGLCNLLSTLCFTVVDYSYRPT